jgi:hypothetical protein
MGLKQKINPEHLAIFMRKFDSDNDGHINAQEVLAFVQGTEKVRS